MTLSEAEAHFHKVCQRHDTLRDMLRIAAETGVPASFQIQLASMLGHCTHEMVKAKDEVTRLREAELAPNVIDLWPRAH